MKGFSAEATIKVDFILAGITLNKGDTVIRGVRIASYGGLLIVMEDNITLSTKG